MQMESSARWHLAHIWTAGTHPKRTKHIRSIDKAKMAAAAAAMETLKRKILLIHQELVEALTSAAHAEESSLDQTGQARHLELKQRDLMKAISAKENELDRATDKLDRTEKQIAEKARLAAMAAEDKEALTKAVSWKEHEVRRLQDAINANDASMTLVTSRSITVERNRKEVEHRVMALEEGIEKQDKQLLEARYLTDEATRKFDEATFKMEKLQVALERAQTRAAKAEKRVSQLEKDLTGVGDGMTQRLSSRERATKRHETLKAQIRHADEQLREAESRAAAEESEQERLQARLRWMQKRKEALRK